MAAKGVHAEAATGYNGYTGRHGLTAQSAGGGEGRKAWALTHERRKKKQYPHPSKGQEKKGCEVCVFVV